MTTEKAEDLQQLLDNPRFRGWIWKQLSARQALVHPEHLSEMIAFLEENRRRVRFSHALPNHQ